MLSAKPSIKEYNKQLPEPHYKIASVLFKHINNILGESEAKVWHGAPVWFIDGNPIVGYALRKKGLVLLFWSGQSFGEPRLMPEGSFKAAEFCYQSVDEIDLAELSRWLEKGQSIQWDYKNIIKNKGLLKTIS